jgi:Raf kinase inhibitor-like YbhB/YbcL family protein
MTQASGVTRAAAAALVCLCVLAAQAAAEEGVRVKGMAISSTDFSAGGSIPRDFTADGKDTSPALSWENAPEGTRCFALICEDPDAPVGNWVHWVIYDIPATARGLPRGVQGAKTLADGSAQGKNDFGRIGYGGPAPPRGKPHRYFFRLYALSEKTGIPAGAVKKDLMKAIEARTLARAELFGTYGR